MFVETLDRETESAITFATGDHWFSVASSGVVAVGLVGGADLGHADVPSLSATCPAVVTRIMPRIDVVVI